MIAQHNSNVNFFSCQIHIEIQMLTELSQKHNRVLSILKFIHLQLKLTTLFFYFIGYDAYQEVQKYRNQHLQPSFESYCMLFALRLMVSSSKGKPALLFLISRVKSKNVSSTFWPLLALTSKNNILCFSASFFPSSASTSLYSCRSAFRAIKILLTFSLVLLYICLIQPPIFLKLCLLLIAQARIIPEAPLQYVWVIFLNLYCPAVSQIWSLNFVSSIMTVLSLKSTPIVATQLSLKTPSQNLVRRLVLPTPLSPMMITLASESLSAVLFAISKVLLFFYTKNLDKKEKNVLKQRKQIDFYSFIHILQNPTQEPTYDLLSKIQIEVINYLQFWLEFECYICLAE